MKLLSRAAKKSALTRKSVKLILFVVAIGVGAYVGMNTFADSKWRPLKAPVKPSAPAMSQIYDKPATRLVTIYAAGIAGGEVRLEAVRRTVPASADPPTAAVRALLTVGPGGDIFSVIPRGTKLISLQVESGLATLDLSHEFTDDFHGGSDQESIALGSLVRTLTQFENIDRVQILVEGRKVSTLGGHFVLTEPLTFKSGQLETGI